MSALTLSESYVILYVVPSLFYEDTSVLFNLYLWWQSYTCYDSDDNVETFQLMWVYTLLKRNLVAQLNRAPLPDLCHAERARSESQLAINILLVHFTSFRISSRSLIPTFSSPHWSMETGGLRKKGFTPFSKHKRPENGVGKINRRN